MLGSPHRRPVDDGPTAGPRIGLDPAGQDGSSPVTAVGGVLVFLAFLFLVVQVSVHLYTSSMAGGVALEAANRAARGGPDGCVTATTWARSRVDGWGADVTCMRGADVVEVRVSGTSPALSMRVLTTMTGLDTITRAARVRREVFDDDA